MTTFGSKESWMEPMNAFLASHRQEFKTFVDDICSISADHRTSTIPPSYATPITILSRLPGTSREGFPSLPYLLDQARECAGLVDTWLDSRKETTTRTTMSEELRKFNRLCEESRGKSKECLMRAEQAERPSGTLEPKWEELVEQMERKARFREATNGNSSPNTPTVEGSIHGSTHSATTQNSSTSSLAESYFGRTVPSKTHPSASRLIIAASPTFPQSPDSEIANDSGPEADTPPGSSSSVWDPGVLNSQELPPTPSEVDDTDLIMPDDPTAIGSSIYSLTPTSKRTSTGTNTTIIPPKPVPLITPSYNRRHPGPRSTYSLRRSSDRADISKTIGPRGNAITPQTTRTSREGVRSREGLGSREGIRSHDGPPKDFTPKSMYRLNTSQPAMDPTGATTRSPSSRDGAGPRLRLGDFGAVFNKRKKVKERE